MFVTRVQIHCDEKGCTHHFPGDGALDGAIFQPSIVRQMAKREGWTRQNRGDLPSQRDLCPAHSAPGKVGL